MWRVSTASLLLLAAMTCATDVEEQAYDLPDEEYAEALTLLGIGPEAQHIYAKRDLDGGMPGVLRFGKRENGVEKKEVPGVLRFGKRTNKKSMPGVLRFGKRNVPGVLRFGKREMPGVLRFGKRTMPGVLRFGKRHEIPGMMRPDLSATVSESPTNYGEIHSSSTNYDLNDFIRRTSESSFSRFGKRAAYDTIPLELLDKKNVPGVLRFGK